MIIDLESPARVLLEPLTVEHAVELFPVLSDSAIYAYISGRPPTSVPALAERYCRLESRRSPDGSQQWLNWAIRRTSDGQCVGFVQGTVHARATADFGYVLGSLFWGGGLAREAAAAALLLLFAEHGATSVFATADRRNLRSTALLRLMGFQRVPSVSFPHGVVEESDEAFRLGPCRPSLLNHREVMEGRVISEAASHHMLSQSLESEGKPVVGLEPTTC